MPIYAFVMNANDLNLPLPTYRERRLAIRRATEETRQRGIVVFVKPKLQQGGSGHLAILHYPFAGIRHIRKEAST